jgi:HAD superfamily hydrolase (TIGR01549 family)
MFLQKVKNKLAFHKKTFLYRRIKKNISEVLWDFDGTLYQSELVAEELRKNFEKFVCEQKPTSDKKEVLRVFNNFLLKGFSFSESAAKVTNLEEMHIIDLVEDQFDKSKFIESNEEIVSFITSLDQYNHYIVSNSRKIDIVKGLSKIGFKDNSIFKKIIDRDDVGTLKPDPYVFEYVQNITKKNAKNHLFIGDSFEHDISPSRKHGFSSIYYYEASDFFSS